MIEGPVLKAIVVAVTPVAVGALFWAGTLQGELTRVKDIEVPALKEKADTVPVLAAEIQSVREKVADLHADIERLDAKADRRFDQLLYEVRQLKEAPGDKQARQ